MASEETKADQEGVGAGELSSAELSAMEPFAGTTHALPASRHSGPQGTVALSHVLQSAIAEVTACALLAQAG